MATPVPKSNPPRLRDVAKAASVSRTTAAKVLLGTGGHNTRVAQATAKRIREVARKLDFRPNPIARQLSGISSRTLGLIQHHGFNRVIAHRIYCIEKIASIHSYRLMTGHAHANPERVREYGRDFTARGVDGLIAIGFTLAEARNLLEARIGHCPIVFHGPIPVELPDEELIGNAVLDRADGIRQAVRHLAQSGRRRIMLVCHDSGEPPMAEKLRGYRAGLVDAGLAFEVNLVPQARSFEVASMVDILPTAILSARPDAIIMPGDDLAVEFVRRAPALGVRVPQDIAVVGFDNSDAAAALDITSIDQENEKVAGVVMQQLLDMLDQRVLAPEQRNVWITPRLVLRASAP